jgi:hypothetical protein
LADLRLSQDLNNLDDLPQPPLIPSIEINVVESAPTSQSTIPRAFERDVTPVNKVDLSVISTPKASRPVTPLHNIMPTYEQARSGQSHGWDDISRSSSVLSETSDSSDEESFYSAHSGSATSPESDVFSSVGRSKSSSRNHLYPPLASQIQCEGQRHGRPIRPVNWTEEMDKHLLTTYHLYKVDPLTTPFQTTRGGVPPLGVATKISREARRTWRVPRALLDSISEHGGVKTPTQTSESGWFATATWPGTDKQTRKRLDDLIRGHRLSPAIEKYRLPRVASFERSRPRFISPEPQGEPSTFSTRSLSLNLMTSTSASFDPNGPLMRMTRQSLETHPFSPTNGTSPQLLGSAFGSIPSISTSRLGSPFEPQRKRATTVSESFTDNFQDVPRLPCSATVPSLGNIADFSESTHPLSSLPAPSFNSQPPPLPHLQLPPPNKRRASGVLPDSDALDIQTDCNLSPAPESQSSRRVRTRGHTLGGVHRHMRPSLARAGFMSMSLSTSESAIILEDSAVLDDPLGPNSHGDIRRLGSPFQPKPINPVQTQRVRSIVNSHSHPGHASWMAEDLDNNSSGAMPNFALPQTTPSLFGNVRAVDLSMQSNENGSTANQFETVESFEQRLNEFRERSWQNLRR